MLISTSVILNVRQTEAWRLLGSCQIPDNVTNGMYYSLGVPRPLACKIHHGDENPKKREYIMEGGRILQSIEEWTPPKRARIRMIRDNSEDVPFFLAIIDSLEDQFDFEEYYHPQITTTRPAVRITRTTNIRLKWWALPLIPSVYSGLKLIHMDVFEAWRQILG